MVILACLVLYLYLHFCTDDVFSFCRFIQLFYNCHIVLIFALLVANWLFCINKFDFT